MCIRDSFGAVDFGKRRVFVHGTFRERVELVVFDPDGEVLGGILELDFRAPFVATYVVGFEHDGFDAGYPYEHTEHDRSFIVGFANFIFAETFDTGDVGPEPGGGGLLTLDGDAAFLRLPVSTGVAFLENGNLEHQTTPEALTENDEPLYRFVGIKSRK